MESLDNSVLELRIYQIKDSVIRDWVKAFNTEVRVINEQSGAVIQGAAFNRDKRDEFIWLRFFRDQESRELIRSTIYDGRDWLEIQDRIRGMLVNRSEQLLYPLGLWSSDSNLFQADNINQINEIRIYDIAEGRMNDWLTVFQEDILKLHIDNGVSVSGLFRSEEDSNQFIWTRSFDNEDHRKIATQRIYQGREWASIRERVSACLEDYSNVRDLKLLQWFDG